MSSTVIARYTCDKCKSTRTINFRRDEMRESFFEPRRSNQNGLIIFSDIHRCESGFLGINNLHIDENNAVRSYEYLTLPKEKVKSTVIPGIPSPKALQEKFKTVRITSIDHHPGFRLRIFDKHLDIILIIGDVIVDDEVAEFTLSSPHDGIILDYYKGEIDPTSNVKNWLQELITILEILPPTKIGLFIDTLLYIKSLLKIPPAIFHLNMLKTILSSHKVAFRLVNPERDFNAILDEKAEMYGHDPVEEMKSIIKHLQKNPTMSLQEFTIPGSVDVSHLVYLFLLMEQDGILDIIRPDEIIY